MPLISFEFTTAFLASMMRRLDIEVLRKSSTFNLRTTLNSVIRCGSNMRPGQGRKN